MSLALSTHGIQNVKITLDREHATRITNQRAMEFFRDMQVLADVEPLATPHPLKSPTLGAIND